MVRTILSIYLKDAAPKLLQAKFDKAVPKVVTGMQSKGLTPQTTTLEVLVRDALFRLWKQVVKSGDIANLIRDHQDGRVIGRVQGKLSGAELLDLAVIVKATGAAAVAETF